MLNPAIKLSKSNIEGTGLVADRVILAGEVLYRFDDTNPPAHEYELMDWSKEKRHDFMMYAIQISDDDFCFRQGDINYINHSCDPTGWWENYGILTARRDISPGEEVAYDYSTADIQLSYRMQCRCKKGCCRRIFTHKDYLQTNFQRKYAGHLPKHVMEAIRRAKANEPDPNKCDIAQAPTHVVEIARQTLSKLADFRVKYGREFAFEMVRQTILQAQSEGSGSRVVPASRKKYDDKYLHSLVTQLIVSPLNQLALKNRRR